MSVDWRLLREQRKLKLREYQSRRYNKQNYDSNERDNLVARHNSVINKKKPPKKVYAVLEGDETKRDSSEANY